MGLGRGLRAVKRRSLTRASVAVAVATGLALAGACGGSDTDDEGDGGLAVGVLLPGAAPHASGSSTSPCSCSS